MCTISWCSQSNQLDVFFNRDESKKRDLALAPKIFQEGNVKAIFPTDPVGGGTWFAVNNKKIVVALLNFYQGKTPKGRLISRGQLVRSLAFLPSLSSIEQAIDKLELVRYAPFSLICFDASNHLADGAQLYRWDGRTLYNGLQQSPLFSSAFKFEDVSAHRHALYQQRFPEGSPIAVEQLAAFHKSHDPEASAYSVCMHRDDAHTVSFSHVTLTDRQATYTYTHGAPCSATEIAESVLDFS